MTTGTPAPSLVKQVTLALQETADTVGHPNFASALRDVPQSDGADLGQAVIRLLAFLDDSVSNPHLGSIFDRSATDAINAMADNLAAAYGVKKTYPGTTGTTGLNVPAVMTLASEGQGIAVGRDCHVSVFGALCLSGAEPVYLVPPFHDRMGVLLPPTVNEVAALLDERPDLEAIVLTMPTYHGLMGDVLGIVRACHDRNVRVMIDEAHGPHFHFLGSLGFPMAAEDAGADMVTQSTHKVLAALNQGSLLHFNDLELIPRYEECQAMGFQSTSFSFPILVSIEHAIRQVVLFGESAWGPAVALADRFREEASRLPGVRTLDDSMVDGHRVIGRDPTRVTLNVRGTGLTGYQVEQRLLDRGVIVEMATMEVVLLLVSPSVTASLLDHILRSLREILGISGNAGPHGKVFGLPEIPARVRSPRQAMLAERERVPRDQAAGRVSGETIGCYPPGQAIVVAGERITAEIIGYLAAVVAAGGHLKRQADDHFQTINVIRNCG